MKNQSRVAKQRGSGRNSIIYGNHSLPAAIRFDFYYDLNDDTAIRAYSLE